MDPHFCVVAFLRDGDYIEYVSMDVHGYITVHTRWLIPGTELED